MTLIAHPYIPSYCFDASQFPICVRHAACDDQGESSLKIPCENPILIILYGSKNADSEIDWYMIKFCGSKLVLIAIFGFCFIKCK